MAALREVQEFRIKYSDVFHLKNLYIMMHEWLVDEGWLGDTGVGDQPNTSHNDIEKLYLERYHQKAINKGGMELWVWWRVKKQPFGKAHGYYQYTMDIDFHGMYLQKVDLMHQGKKLKVDKGELELFFRPKIVATAEAKKWDDHWFLKFWKDLFEKRIWSTDLDKMEKDLWKDAYRLQAVVKAYLNLRNFIPVPEPFHPKLYGMEGEF